VNVEQRIQHVLYYKPSGGISSRRIQPRYTMKFDSGRLPLDKTRLLICCPLTTQIKNYPFEVLIAGTPQNVVLADQVKRLDWRARKAMRKGAVSVEELADVRAKIRALIS
jgi:hypothetical protein